MPILLSDIFGNPNIGIYGLSNENFAIVPKGMSKNKIKKFGDCLKVNILETNLADSRLIGIFLVANTKGIILPHITRENEIRAIKSLSDIRIGVLQDKITALGNMILANDNGAIASSILSNRTIRKISDILDVEVIKGEIFKLPYVGSMALATNDGVLSHPSITDDEKKLISDVLKVEVTIGTINNGTRFIRSGLIANSKGAVVGYPTVGKELMILTKAIKVY
ncbi:translation initiation factor IF-6 [[Eubacterium] cellulosolvens]